jgi:hypothetical protein
MRMTADTKGMMTPEQAAHHDSLWADYLAATGEAKTVAARRCYAYTQSVVNA